MSTLHDSSQTSGDHDRRWCLLDNTELLWHAGADEALVYNCSSGDTHLFDHLSAALLEVLAERIVAESELVTMVAQECAIDLDVALPAVRQRLDNLRQLDLIRVTDS